jgi:hypothetical protein
MATIESEELRSPYVIAELNNKIANKEIWRLRTMRGNKES